jgi:hypothetical protein
MDEEITTSQPFAENLNSQLDSISATSVRISPFSRPGQQPPIQESTYEDFQSGPTASSFDDGVEAENTLTMKPDAFVDNVPSEPPQPEYLSPQVDEGKQCPQCGNMNRADAEECEYCREPFASEPFLKKFERMQQPKAAPPVPAKPAAPAVSEKPAAPRKEPLTKKPTKTKTTQVSSKKTMAILPAITFVVGCFLGILLSPGYLNVVPSKDALLGSAPERPSPTPTSQPKPDEPKPKPVDPKLPKNPKPVEPVIEMPLKENYDTRLKAQLDETVNHVDVYLFALSQGNQTLKENLDSLNKEFPSSTASLPDVTKVAETAEKWERALKSRLDYARDITRRQEWESLDKAFKKLKEAESVYKNLNPETNPLLSQVQKASQKAADELAKLRKTVPKKPTSVGIPGFMGSWYGDLKAELNKLQDLCNQNLSFQSTGAGIKCDSVKVNIKKMNSYYLEIQNSVQDLDKATSRKSPQEWIRWRRETSTATSQLRQADMLESFVKNKKFTIDIQNELQQLKRSAVEFQKEVSSGQQISESAIGSILKALQAIHEKYDEIYTSFNSAVTNFQYWNS